MTTYTFELPKRFLGHKTVKIYALTRAEAETIIKQNTGMNGTLIKAK